MEETNTETPHILNVPFFLRVVAILILVTGSIGVIFYLLSIIYQIADRNFLYELKYKGFSGSGYYVILLIQLALNLGLTLSAMLLLRLRRVGLYLFAISYIVFASLSYLVQDDYGLSIPAVGLFLLFIIALHYKRLN
jgi:hypothetical protein